MRKAGFLPFVMASSLLLVVYGVPLFVLLKTSLTETSSFNTYAPYLWNTLKASFIQASLSALISLFWGLGLALALFYSPFRGRPVFLGILGLVVILPAILVIAGIVQIYGNNGLLNHLFMVLGWGKVSFLYSLSGILIGHVFFNMPLCCLVFYYRLQQVSKEMDLLAQTLGIKCIYRFFHVEWPTLKPLLWSVAGFVFLICFLSFAIVLVLGGGAKGATLEVAIYQALNSFNISQAVLFSFVQSMLAFLFLMVFVRKQDFYVLQGEQGTFRPHRIKRRTKGRTKGLSFQWIGGIKWLVIMGSGLFIILPLGSLVVQGLNPAFLHVITNKSTWNALETSFLLAFGSCALALLWAYGLLQRPQSLLAQRLSFLSLVISPFVWITGWFMISFGRIDVTMWAPLFVIVSNALTILPFLMRLLSPIFIHIEKQYGGIMTTLGIKGWNRIDLVIWPLCRRTIIVTIILGMGLAIGDFGVIAFLGSENLTTLPLLLRRLMGMYQMNGAASLGFVMILFYCGLALLSHWLLRPRKQEEEALNAKI